MIYIDGERVKLSDRTGYSKVLNDVWKKVDEKFDLENGGLITFERTGKGKKIGIYEIKQGTARQVNETEHYSRLPINASASFVDKNGSHDVRYSKTHKKVSKNGRDRYGDAYIDFGKDKVRSFGKKDRELILFLLIFCRDVKPDQEYTNYMVGRSDNYRLSVLDKLANAKSRIEEMVRDSDVVNIVNGWSENKLKTFLKINGHKNVDMDIELLRLSVIDFVRANKKLYNNFKDYHENYQNVSTELMDLIEDGLKKGVIGYRTKDGIVEYGFMDGDALGDVFHKHNGTSLNRDLLELFLSTNNKVKDKIKEAL
jgi:hypothetical protein